MRVDPASGVAAQKWCVWRRSGQGLGRMTLHTQHLKPLHSATVLWGCGLDTMRCRRGCSKSHPPLHTHTHTHTHTQGTKTRHISTEDEPLCAARLPALFCAIPSSQASCALTGRTPFNSGAYRVCEGCRFMTWMRSKRCADWKISRLLQVGGLGFVGCGVGCGSSILRG